MALKFDSSLPAFWHGGKRPLSSIIAIVFHYTGNAGSSATARGNAAYFRDGCPERKNGVIRKRPASAHIVVDTGDTAYLCVPLDVTAYAVGDGRAGPYGRLVSNYNSVSIEMVSRTDSAGRYYIPDETIKHAREVYLWLLKQLPNVRYVIRHYDVSLKLCPAPYINQDKWAAFLKYMKEGDEVVEQSRIIVNGVEKPVKRILKDGTNYVRLRDIVQALAGTCDLEVSSQGSIPVLKTE
jgi:N-acetylmuramoyl-L-alanine amidase CwlA